jgi:endo-1,4-beta-xylanase
VQTGSAEITLTAESQPKLDPYKDGLPKPMQQALADRYAGLFKIFLRHKDVVTRVTLWGLTDADSWKNNWPVRGRTNYPLLFDREAKPKPAVDAIVKDAN